MVLPRNVENLSEEEMIALADKVLDQAVAAITTEALVPVRKKQAQRPHSTKISRRDDLC